MTAAQDLRLLIDGYSMMVSNLDTMISTLDDEIASLNAEVTTITDGVLTASKNALLTKLEARRVAEGWQIVRTWGDFGVLSIKEWNIHGYDGNPWTNNITRLSDDSFSVTGAVFIPIVPVTFVKCQAGNIERTVTNVDYIQPEPGPFPPEADGTTTVTLQSGETPLPNPLNSFERTEAKYQFYPSEVNWDSDPDIIQDMDAFDVGYDEIHAPIDLNGTYGLLARAANISAGRGVQVTNRNQYQEFVTSYEPYAAS